MAEQPESELKHETPVFKLEMKPRAYDEHKCLHTNIYVDEAEWQITCRLCGAVLDPVAFLVHVARQSTFVKWQLAELEKALKSTRDKTRCKCQHCGKMTSIVR